MAKETSGHAAAPLVSDILLPQVVYCLHRSTLTLRSASSLMVRCLHKTFDEEHWEGHGGPVEEGQEQGAGLPRRRPRHSLPRRYRLPRSCSTC